MTDEQEVAELRKQIQQAMKTAPGYINSASVQVVRQYKQGLVDAHKLLRKRGATSHELRAVLARIGDR